MSSSEVGEMLDGLERLMDRTKVMYEQYFMGIQKIPPSQLHRDIERKIRELTQNRTRSTAQRYRLSNLSQRFGSYNSYWSRTMRKIENGTHIRDVARVARRAANNSEDVPDEVLNAMPKRMRDRILRERERTANVAARRATKPEDKTEGPKNVHSFAEEDLAGVNLDAMFDALTTPSPAAEGTQPRAQAPSLPKPPFKARQAGVSAQVSKPPQRVSSPPKIPPARAEAKKPSPPPQPGGQGRASLPPGMNERESREFYNKYASARQSVGAKSQSYEKLMTTLSKQTPEILKKHKAAAVDFNVEIKDNKVFVKAKPKK